MDQVIANTRRDRIEAVLMVPDWPIQYWYPQVVNMEKQTPLYFQPSQTNLVLSHKPKELHPLHKKL